ncbi:hypothetical protein lerEdw1_012079 [Lerista edwardsae]|nr:hypothetical protein lerEdw1_012079 [Lerista edwardsae]
MSLAIRKRSWEEHVTQWMGLPFGSLDYNILCRHGLIADSVQAGMENDGIQSEGQKERSASLPDCCHGGELVGFSSKLLGNVSKEVDENDNHQGEDDFFSLEDSTETLVSGSIEGETVDDGMNLLLEKVGHHFTHDDVSGEKGSLEGAGLFVNVEPSEEAEEEWHRISEPVEKINEPNYEADPKPANGEGDSSDSREENSGLHPKNSLDEDASKEDVSYSPNVEKNTPEEKEVHSTVEGHPCEKSDGPIDGIEKSICNPLPDEFSLCQCIDKSDPTSSVSESSNSLVLLPGSCFRAEENNMDQNSIADSQEKSITSMSLVGGVTYINNNIATQESTDGQVILRKRKVMVIERLWEAMGGQLC